MGSELKGHQALELTPLHKTILALLAVGLKNTEIAEVLNVTPTTVSSVRNHPDGQPILARMTADHVSAVSNDVRECITAASMEAFLTVQELMRGAKNESVRMNSAFDIMDRAGFKPKEAAPTVNLSLGDGAGVFLQAMREIREPTEEYPQLESSEGVFDINKRRNGSDDS
jgi:hypothetical protein